LPEKSIGTPVVTAGSGQENTVMRGYKMKQKCQVIQARWLASRAPSQRSGSQAEMFADECWSEGLRLATSQQNHYQQVMNIIRWSFTA